jgi:signal transduction histidine kinase
MPQPTDHIEAKEDRASPFTTNVFGPFLYVGVLLAAGYWFLDAAMEAFLLSHGDFASNAFAPNPDNVWMRLFTGSLFVIFGALTQLTIKRQARAEQERTRLAAEASLAAENARLYKESQRLLEELRTLQGSRDRFFASVNHELRNALTAVHGWVELLIRELGTAPPRSAREILDSARYALELLDDLLDLSRIDVAKLNLRLARTTASTLVQEALRTVEPSANAAGVHLEVRGVDSELPCRTDATRVRQILVNLLINAVTHSPRGATVTLEVQGNDSELAFAVVDRGKGIAEDQLATIFDAYATMGSQDGGGAGLGLTLSRELARLLGGDIEVETELGKGTRFRVRVMNVPEDSNK